MAGEQVIELQVSVGLSSAECRNVAIRMSPRSRVRALAVLGFFVALSLLLTYPLAKDLGTRVLGPPAPDDNFEYLQKIWWFKHALFDAHITPFFDASVFYPFGFNLVLVETTLSNTILALPLTILFGEVAAYNLIMLLSFVLSGLATYLLVLKLSRSRVAGLLSGVVFAFCPYRMAHLGAGHLPLMGTQWLPLLLLYLDRMVLRRRGRDAFMAALFYTLGALSSWYYAYMFALAGILYVLLRGRPWRQHLWQPQFLRCAMAFALVCLLLVGPFMLPVTRLADEGSRPQSLRYLDYFSASPLDFFYPNVMHPLWGVSLLQRYSQNVIENALYVGFVAFVLAAVAAWRRHDRTTRAFAWLTVIFAIMALGTTLHWGNAPVYIRVPGWLERVFSAGMGFLTKRLALYPISSYSLRVAGAIFLPLPTLLLYLYLPFFSGMRVWARFGLVAVLGVSVLAGLGLQQLRNWVRQRWGAIRGSIAAERVVTLGVLLLVLLEFAVFPYALGTCSAQARPVDQWLAGQDGDFSIMEFPLSKALSGRALYATRTHGKWISCGQSTFFPRAFTEKLPVLESFPSEASVALLKEWRVRYVLVGARTYGAAWSHVEANVASNPGLQHVVTFDDPPIYEGDRVLRLLLGTERAFVVDRIYVYEVL